jgi:hypothetical protein
LEYREIGTGDPIEAENLMEFRLLYEGELLPSGNRNTRPSEKHRIRRAIHPQLRRQWQTHSSLRQLATYLGNAYDPIPLNSEQERFEHGINAIGKKWGLFDYNFVPMVTEEQSVRCSLDILLLRPEDKKLVLEQGDIDGQIKTIFDALALPRSPEQVGGNKPEDDEIPFFCLLQDDHLISEVHVTADQLLMLPKQRELKAHDAFVLIHVRLNHRPHRTLDNWFG